MISDEKRKEYESMVEYLIKEVTLECERQFLIRLEAAGAIMPLMKLSPEECFERTKKAQAKVVEMSVEQLEEFKQKLPPDMIEWINEQKIKMRK